MQRLLFGLLLFMSALPCFADCESIGNAMAEKLHPGMKLDTSLVACKTLPDDETKTILVLPFESNGPPDLENHPDRDIEILIIASDTKTILSRLFEKNAWSDDAFAFSGALIDTARYQLSPQDRAFGVSVGRSNSHHGGGGSIEDLVLYVAHKENIVPVLGLEIHSLMQWSETPSNGCSFSMIEVKRTLAIARTKSHGYADIILDESKHLNGAKLDKGRCEKSDARKRKKYLLRYDGKGYVVPAAVSSDEF